MKKLLLLGVIFLLILSSGCGMKEENVSVIAEPMPKVYSNIELYIKRPMPMGKYEPAQGVYLGAYIGEAREGEEGMKSFEKTIGQKQAFRVFQYNKDKPITSQDMLRCMANRQVPYIKILLDNTHDITSVYEMIGDINNRYSNPIFIELFPVTKDISDPKAYKKYYEEAYKIIKRYIKDVVVVWSIDLEHAYDAPLYYPGNHIVDWVGMNSYWPKYKDNSKYELSPLTSIDFIYKNFQSEKPMLISSLAVSHFSRIDHTYTIDDAKSKLDLFYDTMVCRYPRIKGIFYVDIDMKTVVEDGLEDYQVSVQKELIEYMNKTLSESKFLHEVYKQEQKVVNQYCNYTIPTLEYGHEVYIKEDYVYSLFKTLSLRDIQTIEEDKEKYYKLSELAQKSQSYYIKQQIE